jgi:phosphoglucosamine mutase
MTNLGFHRAMAAAGIKVMTTAVGDRYVLESLDDHRLSLGGEQSGHIICRELATTGDGVLAGVQLLDVVARESDSFAALSAAVMSTVPQLLENVRLATRNPGAGSAIADQVAAVEAEFGDDGRVVVRPSGTEPLLRIMVEHIDQATAEEACRRLVAEAERVLGTVG